MPILLRFPRQSFILAQIRFNHATNLTRINKVVIANRGEIAMRVLRTARRLGIETVAVFSDADANSLHTRSADQAYHIGQALPLKSYLRIDALVDVAKRSGAQAIHPGYGFLSECRSLRGTMGMSRIRSICSKKRGRLVGFPVMMKAVRGGGGKGMRIARSEKEFFESLESAKSESAKAFGDDAMIIEKFVERPRHVEVQVFGDRHDNYVYLWERDCSIQRRHQKIIEEAPAPGLSMETRHKLGKAAVDAARAVNYVGAGTVEFIMDPRGDFYFMEMNTRLQVEHPISEAITGVDLVEWQFRTAQGEQLPKKQTDITLNGHALEARVYAEDSRAGFMPTAGLLEHLSFPTNARIDSGVEQGDFVTVHYDPMIAKVIVHGADRNEAISRLDAALANTHIGGLCNNVEFVRSCLNHPKFVAGNVYTDFIQDHEKELLPDVAPLPSIETLAEGVVGQLLVQSSGESPEKGPFHGRDYFRLNHSPLKLVKLDDKSTATVIISQGNSCKITAENHPEIVAIISNVEYTAKKPPTVQYSLEVNGKRWTAKAVQLTESIAVFGSTHAEYPVPAETTFDEEAVSDANHEARAPMPGVIEKVLIQAGESVTAGQAIIVMIAMKMEHVIRAPFDCVVEAVNCDAGKHVSKNAVLAKYALPEEK